MPSTPGADGLRPPVHKKPTLYQRQSSTLHYQTFPTAPPKQSGIDKPSSTSSPERSRRGSSSSSHHESPLPRGQLAVLAVIALAEQTALNSISPYLPAMASSFPDVNENEVGLYVGLIASSFALAQFATNFLWGWLSDRIGRKPIVLTGTFLTACCFVAFGFCRTLWQAVLVQAMMGLVNGNQGVISTCLGEITDRSNQSRAFTYLPVIYGIGGITGPIVGGLLVMQKDPFHPDQPNPYPYLLPNLVSAAVLGLDLIIAMLFLEESLEEAHNLPPLGKRVGSLFSWLWQFTSSSRPSYLRRKKAEGRNRGYFRPVSQGDAVEEVEQSSVSEPSSPSSTESAPLLFPQNHDADNLSRKDIFNRDTILLLATFLIFQLSNISYNSLYPIFAQAHPPTGRDLSPEEIGISLAFAGVITILFQVGIFGRLREKIGNRITYRVSLGGFVIAFLLMPWVGYKSGQPKAPNEPASTQGRVWLWMELGLVLIIKTVAAVGGLTSALLLITNSAPSHAVLGTLNGLAQTLSAAGRAVGPFLSGALFSAATRVQPKGEALAFGVFGGVALIGFLMSFGIRGVALEADGWDEQLHVGDEEEGDDEDTETEAESDGRRQGGTR
ncbi:hypothetical protein MBLNU230_g7580t1 [Neophaeotheca triangularis]